MNTFSFQPQDGEPLGTVDKTATIRHNPTIDSTNTKDTTMAYINQDTKAKIVAKLNPILAQYGIKATFSVRNHMSFVMTIKSGKIDFIENYLENNANKLSGDQIQYIRNKKSMDINQYWFQEHFTGKSKEFLEKVFTNIKSGGEWFDESDIMTDYFHTAFYINVSVGTWDKPYQVV